MRVVYDGGTGETLSIIVSGELTGRTTQAFQETLDFLSRPSPYKGWTIDLTETETLDDQAVGFISQIAEMAAGRPVKTTIIVGDADDGVAERLRARALAKHVVAANPGRD